MKNLSDLQTMRYGLNSFIILLMTLFFVHQGYAQKVNENPKSIEELEESIRIILKNKQTPSVGIAMVDSTGPLWITSIGKADMEQGTDANEDTMYRIGSVSKMFVALAILKLQEEGKLSLKDKLKDWAPELEYENKWAENHPILIEHLLEHTTGWDDWHLEEGAHSDSVPISLKDGLDYHPHSRVARWVPGTRMSYSNSGPPSAAYIVEKITNLRFEDYIQSSFFDPMGMKTATYFQNETYQKYGATLYLKDKPQPYWHIIQRPSGSINASPKDFTKMIEFFVNRGMVNNTQLISEASLIRMETPMTNLGAQSGLEVGYGLANYSVGYQRFIFRSHGGGVNGGLTDFSYIPEYGIGYMISINSDNGDALNRIGNLIKKYLTRNLSDDSPELVPNAVENPSISGYYTMINPRNQRFYFLDRLFDVTRARLKNGKIYFSSMIGQPRGNHIQLTKTTFASEKSGVIDLVQVDDPIAGKVLHRGGWQVLGRIPGILAVGKILLMYTWISLMGASILFACIMFIRSRIKKYQTTIHKLWLWPFIASASFGLVWLLITVGSSGWMNLGRVNFFTISIMINTICFGVASVISVWIAIQKRISEVSKPIYWASMILIAINFLLTIYFLLNGGIGLRTWA